MLTVLIIAFVVLAALQLVTIAKMEKNEGKMSESTDKDLAAYQALIDAILENKRLAWAIVQRWLEKNNYMLVPKNYSGPVNQQGNHEAD